MGEIEVMKNRQLFFSMKDGKIGQRGFIYLHLFGYKY